MAGLILIEDDWRLGQLYKTELEKNGLSTHWAPDAQTALDILDEYGADLIILDLMLPQNSGIEVLNELQSHQDWQSIPVIILSSQPKSAFSKADLTAFRVVDYLYKPDIKLKTLTNCVKLAIS